MPECTQCGEYTKFNGGLCYECYKSKNANKKNDEVSVETKNEPEAAEGLAKKDWNFRYNMIKGRIAETLIQELFLSLNYNVFRYGMENTIPGIMELLKGVDSSVATEIKRMPDFVVQNPQNNEV